MLTDKCIQYSSDIKEEDFKLLYDTLKEQGWWNRDGKFEKTWGYFTSPDYPYFREYPEVSSYKSFVTSSSPTGVDIISFQEIFSQIRTSKIVSVIVNKETFFPKVEEIL